MPEYVYALHDFKPENPDEVAFSVGDRIEVLEKDDLYGDGWWQVSLQRCQRIWKASIAAAICGAISVCAFTWQLRCKHFSGRSAQPVNERCRLLHTRGASAVDCMGCLDNS